MPNKDKTTQFVTPTYKKFNFIKSPIQRPLGLGKIQSPMLHKLTPKTPQIGPSKDVDSKKAARQPLIL